MNACRPMAVALLALLACPAVAEARPRSYSLGELIRRTLSPRSTLFSLARHLGCPARKASKVIFGKERLDELHPGLSLPGDLPGTDWPHRAVIASDGRLWKVPFRMRIATELAVLTDAKRRRHLLNSSADTLVLVLTVKAKTRDTRITPGHVERELRRMGVSVSITGSLGRCDPETDWCHLQTYYIRSRRGRRGGAVVLELSRPAGDKRSRVRGIKIVRAPAAAKK